MVIKFDSLLLKQAKLKIAIIVIYSFIKNTKLMKSGQYCDVAM